MKVSYNHNTAFFAFKLGFSYICCRYLYKIIAFFAVFLKTFRAIALSQFISFDGQMTVPTPQPVFLLGQLYQLAMVACSHVYLILPKLSVLNFRIEIFFARDPVSKPLK